MSSATHQQKCTCHTCISPPKTPFISPSILLKNLPLDNNSSNPYKHLLFTLPAITPSGIGFAPTLQSLPTELYGEILSYLTVQEVTDLRRVSQYTRFSVDGVLQYQELYTFAPSVIRAALATKTAERITLRELYYALTNPECMVCGGVFGTNMCLFTGERVCVWCLRNEVSLQPVEVKSILKLAFNGKSKARGLLPLKNALKVVPGMYMVRGKGSTSVKSARKALLLERDVEEEILQLLTEAERKIIFGNPESWEAEHRRSVKHNPLVGDHVESDISPQDTNALQPGGMLARQAMPVDSLAMLYMTSIFIPCLHPKTKVMDHGVVCEECMLHMRWLEHKRMAVRWSTASDRRRALINEARRKSCIFYLRQDLEAHVKEEHEGVQLTEEEDAHRTLMIQRKKDDLKEGGDGDLAELKFHASQEWGF